MSRELEIMSEVFDLLCSETTKSLPFPPIMNTSPHTELLNLSHMPVSNARREPASMDNRFHSWNNDKDEAIDHKRQRRGHGDRFPHSFPNLQVSAMVANNPDDYYDKDEEEQDGQKRITANSEQSALDFSVEVVSRLLNGSKEDEQIAETEAILIKARTVEMTQIQTAVHLLHDEQKMIQLRCNILYDEIFSVNTQRMELLTSSQKQFEKEDFTSLPPELVAFITKHRKGEDLKTGCVVLPFPPPGTSSSSSSHNKQHRKNSRSLAGNHLGHAHVAATPLTANEVETYYANYWSSRAAQLVQNLQR